MSLLHKTFVYLLPTSIYSKDAVDRDPYKQKGRILMQITFTQVANCEFKFRANKQCDPKLGSQDINVDEFRL